MKVFDQVKLNLFFLLLRSLFFFLTLFLKQNGPYGPPYALDRANTRSYSDLLGLDILWGWGMNYEFPNHSYFGNGGKHN